jgi:hypothetical protein
MVGITIRTVGGNIPISPPYTQEELRKDRNFSAPGEAAQVIVSDASSKKKLSLVYTDGTEYSFGRMGGGSIDWKVATLPRKSGPWDIYFGDEREGFLFVDYNASIANLNPSSSVTAGSVSEVAGVTVEHNRGGFGFEMARINERGDKIGKVTSLYRNNTEYVEDYAVSYNPMSSSGPTAVKNGGVGSVQDIAPSASEVRYGVRVWSLSYDEKPDYPALGEQDTRQSASFTVKVNIPDFGEPEEPEDAVQPQLLNAAVGGAGFAGLVGYELLREGL